MDERPDLEQMTAHRLAALLDEVEVGSSLSVEPPCAFCDALELLVPQVLRREHPEWERESIDGFSFSSAVKTSEDRATLAGLCILISDQTVTPFVIDVGLTADGAALAGLRVKLGEPGAGLLGISGPGCRSRRASARLAALEGRLDEIQWVYEVDRAVDG